MRSGIQETFRGAGVFTAGKLYENMRWFTFSKLSAATRERGQTMDDALALNPRPSMLSHLQELERMYAGRQSQGEGRAGALFENHWCFRTGHSDLYQGREKTADRFISSCF
ncbi:hypothetical protein DB345_16780 [Spartobacteria bacterium LR76]|nr:hypothetical protein DB345_16780 [Spartobacteria bacterium LR76]